MINSSHRFSDNVPGSWYVNDECISCGMCGNDVPAIFSPSADHGHYRVHRQPVGPEEIREAEDARESCPVEAIVNDGPA